MLLLLLVAPKIKKDLLLVHFVLFISLITNLWDGAKILQKLIGEYIIAKVANYCKVHFNKASEAFLIFTKQT